MSGGVGQIHPAQQSLPTLDSHAPQPAPAATSHHGDPLWDAQVRARIALSLLVEPGDRAVGAEVQQRGAVEVAEELGRVRVPSKSIGVLSEAVTAQLERAAQAQAICLVPGYPGWPTQLDDLAETAPLLLWARGNDLRIDLLRSVAIVGARACSPYGRVQAETLAAELALFGWAIVSGGAYGIDAAAHQGALAVAGRTVLVSAGGVDKPYPRAHEHLYRRIAQTGSVVSECPLGAPPARHRFPHQKSTHRSNESWNGSGRGGLEIRGAGNCRGSSALVPARDGRPRTGQFGPVHRLPRPDSAGSRHVGGRYQ